MRSCLFCQRREYIADTGFVPSLLIGLFFFLATPTASSQNQEDTARLAPRQAAIFYLPPGGSLTIGLDISGFQKAELLIEASAPGADFTVHTPGEKQILSASTETDGWLAVSFPVTVPGTYRLVVRQNESKDEFAGIRFRAELLPVSAQSAAKWESAEALFSSAQTLRRSTQGVNVRAAIEKYRQAAIHWADPSIHEPQILALAGEATAWIALSKYQLADRTLDRAIAISSGSPHLRAWLLGLESQSFLDQWKSEQAERFAQKALSLSRSLSDTWLIADALADRGESRYLTQDPLGLNDIEDALKLARENNAVMTVGRALRCESWIEEDLGYSTRAISLMQEAQDSFRRAGDPRDAWEAMSDIASDQGVAGDWYSAVVRHSRMEPLASIFCEFSARRRSMAM